MSACEFITSNLEFKNGHTTDSTQNYIKSAPDYISLTLRYVILISKNFIPEIRESPQVRPNFCGFSKKNLVCKSSKFNFSTFQLFKSMLFWNPEKFEKDYVITYYADFSQEFKLF